MHISAERILSLAKERGVKQQYISELIGGYRGKTTDWKQGKSSPSERDLEIIAKNFNVSVAYLRGDTHDPTPADEKKSSLSDLKEGVRQELIKRGKITPDKELSDKDWDAILSVAEIFANRSDD